MSDKTEKTFEGQVALVTGSSRGIGQAIALELAEQGATVIATGTKNADATVSLIQEKGGKAESAELDLANAEQIQELLKKIVADHGRIDILVNNAGITKDGLMLMMTEESFSQVIDINLKGAFLCTKAAIRPMMKARYGRIINITSVVGINGNAGQANYAASKGGLIALTKSTAKEIGSRGITCNAVAPGYTRTEMTESLSDEQKKAMIDQTPLKRLGEPVDIAKAVCFLASAAAGFITGETLRVDGGMAM